MKETFDKEWKDQATPFIIKAFEGFVPRSEFLKKRENLDVNKLLDLQDEQPNILSVKTSLSTQSEKLIDFDEAMADCPNYSAIREKMNAILDIVSSKCTSAKATFVTFSTDITGAKAGIKHLHPRMNGDRCNVWTWGIPLYIGKTAPSFDIHMSDKPWSTRYYLDYKRIRESNFDYQSMVLPKDGSVFNMQFDGMLHPHVITYTDSIYMWFVFDGVEYKDDFDVGASLLISNHRF